MVDVIINKVCDNLLKYQIPHLLQLLRAINNTSCILDASDTGTGKTYTAIALSKILNRRPFIICPKSVIPSWLSVVKYFNVDINGIANYELIKSGRYYECHNKTNNVSELDKYNCQYVKKITIDGKDDFIVNFPEDTFIILDEAHRCKNYKSISSRLLIALKNSGNKILLLSATLIDKIDCFKPFGVVFDLYDDVDDYKYWMKHRRTMYMLVHSTKRRWSKTVKDDAELSIIHKLLFPHRGSRMKIADLGTLFPHNQITSLAYYCRDYDKVQYQYEIINRALIDLKNKETRASALGKIIRARQKIEMYKVPIFLDLAEEGLDSNYSIVIFVNFKDTMRYLAKLLKTNCLIHGDQKMDERQRCIDAFQNNKYKVIIAIIQAGGVGISLHDIHGYHPRLSLISPTWTGYDIKQALGRIHRAGAKTPALQRLIFCANTYEDKINDIIKRKLRNIDAINNGDLMGPDFATKEMVELADHVSRDNLIILKKSQKVFKIKK